MAVIKNFGLDFKPQKSNSRYIEFGASNKQLTIKSYYISEVTGIEQMIKVQINFVEAFFYPIRKMKAKSLILGLDKKEFSFLFPEYSDLLKYPDLMVYDIKEIMLEKFRAVLIRRGVKARDFIDIYIISKNEKIEYTKLKKEIIDKTKFVLKFDKYFQNFNKIDLEKYILREEEKLLLKPVGTGFNDFLKEIMPFISELIDEIQL